MPEEITVRDAEKADLPALTRLHAQLGEIQFIARGGPSLLATYDAAWLEGAGSLALVAIDHEGVVRGMLLGAIDPASHYRAMVRQHGVALAGALVVAAATRAEFRRELVQTRLVRYGKGLVRMLRTSLFAASGAIFSSANREHPPAAPSRSAEVTHVVVEAGYRGSGVGRALLAAAEQRVRAAGVESIELVAEPHSGAAAFYERLGWLVVDSVETSSGEGFVKFRRVLT